MSLVRRLYLLLLFLIAGSVPARSQAGDPVAALNELLGADQVTDAVKHYPVAVEEALRALQGEDKAEAAMILLMQQKPGGVVYKLRKPSDAGPGEAEDNRVIRTVVHSFVSGNDAIIVTRVNLSAGGGANRFFSLRFEAGEWRLRSIGALIEEENYDSDGFIQQLLPTGRNEIAAVETLRKINSSLEDYNATEGTVYPSSLSLLVGPTQAPAPQVARPTQVTAPEVIEKPDIPEGEPETGGETGDSAESAADRPVPSERALLLDPVFMNDPAIKDGYAFHYKLIDPGTAGKDDGLYQITAIPVQFGKTGNKSYFIDQTAIIRYTNDNREANENDEPLNNEREVQQLFVDKHPIIR